MKKCRLLFWSCRLLALVVFAAVLVVVPPTPDVSAQANPQWVCDGTPILMRGGKFHHIVPDPAVPGNLTIQTIPNTKGIWNSTGYDPTTNWVYGVGSIGGQKTVRAYDANGGIVFETQIQDPYPDDAGTYAGTVLGDGRYIIHSVGNGNGSKGWYAGSRFNLWSIDPVTGAAIHIGSTSVNFADFSYNPLDGYLYQVVNRKLYKVDPNTGATSTTNMPGAFPNGSFGASWFDAAGFLYLFRNSPGDIFKVDPDDTSTWVEVGEVGADGGTDAGSCISQIDIKKDVVDAAGNPILPADRVYSAGDSVFYKFTLINNGLPTKGLTADLCDVLPADGRTYSGVWSSTAAATLTSGGAAGDTSICLEVDMPSSLWTDPANPGAAPTEVTVEVVLGANALPGVAENQATLDYDQDNIVDVLSDDPGDGSDPRDPTTILINGSMEIAKTVIGHPVDDATDQFPITLNCGAHIVAAGSIVSDTDGTAWPTAAANGFTLTGGDRVRITDIPGGTTCVATEATSTAYATTTVSGDGTATANSGTITIDEASDDELIEFTNRTGSFRLVKRTDVSASALPVDEDGEFTFDLVCDNGLSQQINVVTSNGSRQRVFPSVPLIADGASCTVTESVPTGWNITSANDQVFSVASGTEPQVRFDNERDYADLTVTKSILGLPASADLTSYSFDVSVECAGGFNPDPYTVPGPLTVATDSPIVIADLPVGTSCTVTEAATPGFNTRYAPGQTVTVEEGGSTVAITNSTGSLIIEKNAVVAGTHPIDPVTDVDFTLVCTDPDGIVTTQPFTVTTDSLSPTGATGGVSHTDIGVMAPGTSCVASELTPPAGWTATSPTSVTLDVTEADPEPTATFENTRDTGTLTVTKTLAGVPAGLDLSAETFTVDVSCSGGFTVDPYVMSGLSVSPATPLVIADLPTGAVCNVTETPDPRFEATVASGTATIDTDGETVALTNTTSSFVLTKTTAASSVVDDADGTFTFAVVCVDGGVEVANTTVTVTTTAGTGSAATADLPVVPPGSTCTVTETVPPGWTITKRTGGTNSGADAIELVTDTDPTVSFENTLDTAPLTITKDVTGIAATPALEAEVFTVTVTCTGNVPGGTWTSGPQNLVEGTPVVLPGLPIGAACTVAETVDGRFATTYSPSDAVTIADGGNTIAITNETSSFSISKTTNVPADVDPDATFTFAISCTAGGVVVYTGTATITTTAGTGTWGAPDAPFVAPGTECSVVETPPADWTVVGSDTVAVTTAGAAIVDAAFTNERATADLTLTKTLLGDLGGTDYTNEPFSIDVSCVGDFAASPLVVNNVIVTANTPAVVPDLPTGAVCTVTEDFDSRFQTLYSPDIGDGSASQVTIDADGAEAGISNVAGILAIRKDTIGPNEHSEDLLVDIDYDVDCTGTAFDVVVTLSVDQITGGQGIGGITYNELPIMPAGTVCTVTEILPPGWSNLTPIQQTLTISTDPATAQFQNERDTAALTITKVLEGVPAGVDLGDEPFTVDISCTGNFTVNPYVISGQTVTANTPLVVSNLPTGAVCSATETPDPRFTSVVSAPVTIDDDGEEIIVTNSTSTLTIAKTTTGATTHPIDLDDTFTFDVDCGAAYSGTVIMTTTGQSGAWDTTSSPLLPPGTDCTVTEQVPPLGWALTSANDVAVTTATSPIVEAAFTNEHLVAPLTIAKTITGAPVDLGDEPFTVNVSCTGGFTTEPYLLGPFTVTQNTPVQIADLPLGAACEVTETPDARFLAGYDPDDQVAIIEEGGVELGIENRTAYLTITKEVTGATDQSLDLSGSFDVTMTCTDGTTQTHTLDVVDGVAVTLEYPTLPLLPDGTACTLTEATPPAGWTLTTPNDVEVVVSSETPGDVTFVNRRDTADLNVTKTVVGAPDSLDLSTLTFTVDVSCVGDFATSPLVFSDQPIKHGETITFANLPTGAVCTVIEDADPRFATTTTPATAPTTGVTIDDDGEDVALVNATGEVMIVKNTEVTTTHPVDVTGSFEFAVDCGAAYRGTHTVDASTITSPTTATGFLRYSDIPAIPDGAACSVTEQGPPTGWTLDTANPVPLTVDSTGVAVATFTNSRDTGSLTVTKVLDGVPAEVDLGDEPFTVDISCTGGFTADPYEIAGQTITENTPLVIDELPTGAVCSVTETADPRFASTISAPVTIDDDGEEVVVTNTTSTLSISKTTDGPTTHPIDLDTGFTFAVECGTLYDASAIISTTAQTGSWGAPNSPLLPPGTDCTITEAADTLWTVTSTNPQTVTTDSAAVVDAAFTNTRDTGSLTVTKVLDGVPAGTDLDAELFDVLVSCSGGFTVDPYEINDTISVDAPLTIDDLPTDAVCTVTETPDPRFATTISAPVTIDADGEEVVVTNTTSTLSIMKTTEGPTTHPVSLDNTFTFDVTCGTLFTATETITTVGQTGTWATPDTPLLPPGTDCTVVETGIPSGWSVATDTVTITTDSADIVEAEFVNTRDTAELALTKVVTGAPAGLNFDDVLFEVTITCTGDFDGGTHPIIDSISANTPLTIADLPTGATCEIVETADAGFTASYAPANATSDAAEVTIVDGGAAAEITNTTGAFVISKETVVDSTHPIDAVDTFSFLIDCGAAYSGTHDITTDTITSTGAMGVLLATDLPTLGEGTVCDITELDESPDWAVATDRTVTLTISSTEPQTASFTNDHVLGSLVVDKTVEGPDGVDLSTEVFDITITCTGGFVEDPYVMTATVSATAPHTVDGLPYGADCAVAETVDPRFATSYTDTDAIIDPAAPATLSILNQTGSFVIDVETLIGSGSPFDPDDDFSITITCTSEHGETYEETLTISTIDGDGTWESPLLPVGHECSVTFDVPDGWAVVGGDTANFVVGTDVQVFGFQSDRTPVTLTISKTLASVPASLDYSDHEFDLTVTCTNGFASGEYVVPGNLVVSQDEALVIENLPAEASCTISEAPDQYFTASYAPAESIVLSATEANEVTITNTGNDALADNPPPALAFTGSEAGRLLWLALLLMGAGFIALGGRRLARDDD